MKKKILTGLCFFWTCVLSFFFPVSFGLIFMDITGHSKGYSYDLGSEKDISIMMGCFELVLWLLLAVPAYVHICRRAKQKGKKWLIGCLLVFLLLVGVCLYLVGGADYLYELFYPYFT